MVAAWYLLNDSIFNVFWEKKIIIIGGIFLGLSIYKYFYRKKRIKNEIFELKKQAKYFEIITINLINLSMSEPEKFSIKEMLSKLNDDFKEFKSEMRGEIRELVETMHDYKQSNNERIAKLEGDQKVTTKTILMYVGFFGGFVMLAVQTYMAFK